MCVIEFIDRHQWIATVIGIIVTMLGIIVTMIISIYQIKSQFKYSIKAQQLSKLDELHLEIYNQIADGVMGFVEALSSLSATVKVIPFNLENKYVDNLHAKDLGVPAVDIINNRYDDFLEIGYRAGRSYVDLLGVIDKYELAFADFGNMRKQIDDKYQVMSKSLMEFGLLVHPYLPYDVVKEDQERLGIKVYPTSTPDEITICNIKKSSSTLCEIILDLMCFAHDLRTETQNTLLSPLFDGKKAPRRNPPDASVNKVLTVDE